MFTGIVACVGTVAAVHNHASETRLTIRTNSAWTGLEKGESVACNGVCLTVEHWNSDGSAFSAYASRETCACSTTGRLHAGSPVNLERAMALGSKMGGHLVSGHVDAVALVEAVRQAGESRCVRISCNPAWCSFVVAKGSVALDGISLTVNAIGDSWFEVNVIPATWTATIACRWSAGTPVNVETDILAKYVRRLMEPYADRHGQETSRISMDFLKKNGF